ncbi:hypothetical protein [Magnetofaba australis]|uniref:Terminase large subunit gp17-like C-terminal domain-containing protein n=1 Tax=Magnetofaba australis IT-1 TaxID=1434232 RepID=A0A1Y2K7P3_9PROT|nr:hypothetical protein [Magnetofaba australis]OSM06763.1 hypothetical protein MAIT1_00380 [Magnetofaba australis IT-1]
MREQNQQAKPLFIAGLDLGQANDYTALAILEQRRLEGDTYGWRYLARHLNRYPRGTSYPDVVKGISQLLESPQLQGCVNALVIDGSGCGRPVVDMFVEARLRTTIAAITVHGGDAVTEEHPERLSLKRLKIPKRDLVGTLQATLQTQRLQFAASLEHAAALRHELENFRAKINIATGHESFEAWREGDHDDLVFAVGLAVWWGERHPPQQYAYIPVRLSRDSDDDPVPRRVRMPGKMGGRAAWRGF